MFSILILLAIEYTIIFAVAKLRGYDAPKTTGKCFMWAGIMLAAGWGLYGFGETESMLVVWACLVGLILLPMGQLIYIGSHPIKKQEKAEKEQKLPEIFYR